MIICEMQTICKFNANYNAFRIFYKKGSHQSKLAINDLPHKKGAVHNA